MERTEVEPATRLTVGGFAALFGLGMVGVVALYPTVLEQLSSAPLPPGASLPVVAAGSLVTPTVLLAVAVVVGIKFAPRVGLQSYVLDRVDRGAPILPRLRRDGGPAVAWGLLAGVLLTGFQFGAGQFLPELAVDTAGASTRDVVASLPVRFLYGGITEEILLRWGFMSPVAFGLAATIERERDAPSARVMWAAVVVAAVVFGIGHLPAAAATLPLTAGVVAYVVVGNAIGGVVFGWVFWRRSLEAAMLSHLSAHVVFVAASFGYLFVA